MAEFKSAVLKLDLADPFDQEIVYLIQCDRAFQFKGQLWEATSIRTTKAGPLLTCKAVG